MQAKKKGKGHNGRDRGRGRPYRLSGHRSAANVTMQRERANVATNLHLAIPKERGRVEVKPMDLCHRCKQKIKPGTKHLRGVFAACRVIIE